MALRVGQLWRESRAGDCLPCTLSSTVCPVVRADFSDLGVYIEQSEALPSVFTSVSAAVGGPLEQCQNQSLQRRQLQFGLGPASALPWLKLQLPSNVRTLPSRDGVHAHALPQRGSNLRSRPSGDAVQPLRYPVTCVFALLFRPTSPA